MPSAFHEKSGHRPGPGFLFMKCCKKGSGAEVMPHEKMNFIRIPIGALQPPAYRFSYLRTLALMAVKMALAVTIHCLNGRLCDIVQQYRKL
jgi:hypothetical protein